MSIGDNEEPLDADAQEAVRNLTATFGGLLPNAHYWVQRLLATIAARDSTIVLARATLSEHEALISRLNDQATHWREQAQGKDAEIARLLELYKDEHDWATAMFMVVEAARGVVAFRNGPLGEATEALELMDKLAVAVKAYGEGKPQ